MKAIETKIPGALIIETDDALEVAVDWGSLLNGIEPVMSEKDMIGPTLDTSDNQFIYNENC